MNTPVSFTYPYLTVVISNVGKEANELSNFLDRMKAKWPAGISKVHVSSHPKMKVYLQLSITKWGEALIAYIRKFKPAGVSIHYYIGETKYIYRY